MLLLTILSGVTDQIIMKKYNTNALLVIISRHMKVTPKQTVTDSNHFCVCQNKVLYFKPKSVAAICRHVARILERGFFLSSIRHGLFCANRLTARKLLLNITCMHFVYDYSHKAKCIVIY